MVKYFIYDLINNSYDTTRTRFQVKGNVGEVFYTSKDFSVYTTPNTYRSFIMKRG